MYLGRLSNLIKFLQIIHSQCGDAVVSRIDFDGTNYSIELSTPSKKCSLSDCAFDFNESFSISELVVWCLKNPQSKVAHSLLRYIYDYDLNTSHKNYKVKHIDKDEWIKFASDESYDKYYGYYLEEADK